MPRTLDPFRLLLLTCGIYANVIRFMFPLTISDPLMAEGFEILRSALLDSAAKRVSVPA